MADVEEQHDCASKSGEKKRRKRRAKGKSRIQRHKEKERQQPRPDYKPIIRDNENMEKYYSLQPMFEEGEFKKFMEFLRLTLPASFRINHFDAGQARFLRQLIDGPDFDEFFRKTTHTGADQESDMKYADDEEKPAILEPMPWYPNNLAWQMNISRVDLRKTPMLQKLHRFLISETENGFISRQEAVSMIPPLLLDVRRGQDILDMCAAPGSKTAQLLEYLKYNIYSCERYQTNFLGNYFDDGMIVANDIDNKRCYMLVHQSSRLNSPNCVIINEDASRLPEMKISAESSEQHHELKFDRILCDVPCSGDGTVRKNPDVWRKWTVGNGNNFHGMQCKILKRGVELLKENGLIVYSTCSMNPVEDEAVVASILRASEGSIVLEDVGQRLKGLKFKPGLEKWVIMNNHNILIPDCHQVPKDSATQIYPGLFPPSEEDVVKFNLNRCMRILPHLQNTGAFFVAVLKKVKPLPWEVSKQAEVLDHGHETDKKSTLGSQQNPKKRKLMGFKEDPFVFMDSRDPDWLAIKRVYGLKDDFPVDQLAYRCSVGKKRTIYLMSKRTRNFILANKETDLKRDFVKIINGGMRLFSRAHTESGFRICQDGVCEIEPYIKDEIKVDINREDLANLLRYRSCPFDTLGPADRIKNRIHSGSFILMYKHNVEGFKPFTMPLVAWKGEKTVALYVANTYRVHLCALAQVGDLGDQAGIDLDEKRADEVIELTVPSKSQHSVVE